MAALHEMYTKDSIQSARKRDVIRRISTKRWFDVRDEDLEPYPSQAQLTGEPRWHTLIAWARKDSVIRDYVSYDARDAWGMTRTGRDAFERFRDLCLNGKRPVSPCYLWSADFKRFMCETYEPSDADKPRPQFFYRDSAPDIFSGF